MHLYLATPKRIFKQRAITPPLLDYANKNRKIGFLNDITIKSGYDTFPANRIVLSCYCRFFEKLFKSQNDEVKRDIVEIEQVDGIALYYLIEYIYTGCINISSDNVFGLLKGAHHLELNDVKKFCFDFLLSVMTTDNCLVVYMEAVKYENFDLKQKIYKMVSEHFEEIAQTEDFKNLSYFDLFPCLYNLNRELVRESVLCRSMINWTMIDKTSRKVWFHNRLIRFVDIKKLPYSVLQITVFKELLAGNKHYLSLVENRIKTVALGNRIISIGGIKSENKALEIWNIEEKAFLNIPDLPLFVDAHQSLKLYNSIVCIGGSRRGYDDVTDETWILDLNESLLRWKRMKSMHCKRFSFGATIFKNAMVVSGGWNGKEIIKSSEAYFPQKNHWEKISPMIIKRTGHQLVTVGDYLYAIGGHNGKRTISSVEKLQGFDGYWEKVFDPLNTARTSFAAVELHNVIYVIGGIGEHCKVLKSVESFDPTKGNWNHCENIIIARCGHSACVFQERIFVVGGWNEKKELIESIECFDPSTKSWTIIGNIQYELADHSLVVL